MAVDWGERLERVKMALAEAGFPEEAKECNVAPAAADPSVMTIYFSPDIPLAIIWQTAKVTGQGDVIPCWSCYVAMRDRRDRQIALDCTSGHCRNPLGEKKPPRELLNQVSNRQTA
jgi:hypothetical protein